MFASAVDIRRDVARLVRPPQRMSVSEAAAKYVKVRTPGGGVGPWDPALTPYMVEPMDCLYKREYESVIFVGPAQSGKTQALIDGWVAHMVICDPSDMMILQTSQETARDFSKRRIDRLHRHSPKVREQLSKRRQHDNTYDKMYKAGNILSIGWPSINQVSGKPIKYMALTDHDRMTEDVGGEGSVYGHAGGRITTFLTRGMVLVESSPGFELNDPQWEPQTLHEAPPARGILSLFNLGDRRRYYWPCQHCGEHFMQPPGIEGYAYNPDHVSTKPKDVHIPCTSCGALNADKDKKAMIAGGLWVPEGCRVENGVIVGERLHTNIASFWLPGAAAAYKRWSTTISHYKNALKQYETTGSEENLKTVTNVDIGTAYLPKSRQSGRTAGEVERRAEDLPKRVVPIGVRFLVAAVDVQKNKFVVQVQGYGVGLESWIVDRYDINWSKRMSNGEALPVDPAGRTEDWKLLTDRVLKSEYPIDDDSGLRMMPMAVGCDSGGRIGVTERAYAYWRSLKGLQMRFALLKGEGRRRSARVHLTYPDSTTRSDRKRGGRGDVPVYLLDVNQIKDGIDADLKRDEPGPGYIHFPDWLSSSFYAELVAEARTDKGWVKIKRGAKNESFDLLGYARAVAIILKAENINWDRPPNWAAEWDVQRTLVGGEEKERKSIYRPAVTNAS